MLQKYEILAIIDSSLDEKKAEQQAQESVNKRIQEAGGKITFEDFWGARGFAYKIGKQTWGYYFCAQFELESKEMLELKRDLNIDGKIIRFLISKLDNHSPAPMTHTEIETQWTSQEKERKISEMDSKKAKRTNVPKKEVIVEDDEEETTKKSVEKESLKKMEKKTEPKKDIIDRKLDEILEDSSLDL
ncbi:30S ribosomal protein S6 [Candidatus Gracilibacteria bacterium]|nr:30S ribosomal protein S6 [Candidatus Gracilibacteria bacterium]